MEALLVIDLQNGVSPKENPLLKLGELIKLVNTRLKLYYSQNKPVIIIQHNDSIELVKNSADWNLFPELAIDIEKTIFIDKTHANSFYHTNLKKTLTKLNIKQLEICGAQTQYCMDTTIRFAHGLGYKLFMKEKAHTTVNGYFPAEDIIKYHEQIWNHRFLTFI